MAQITEDYVSLETARLLKEKGFNEETAYAYSNNGELLRLNHFGIKDLTNTDCNGYNTWQFPIEGVASIISAPTLQMAMKWLLQTHNIFIEIRITNHSMSKLINVIRYYWILSCSETCKWVDESTLHTVGAFISPEEACEAAIKYCLANLI